MAYGLIGIYALYCIMVGVKGNASTLYTNVMSDGVGFIPWVVAILILRALYNVKGLQPFVKPFVGLAVLTFVLKNYSTMAGQLNQILPANAQFKVTA